MLQHCYGIGETASRHTPYLQLRWLVCNTFRRAKRQSSFAAPHQQVDAIEDGRLLCIVGGRPKWDHRGLQTEPEQGKSLLSVCLLTFTDNSLLCTCLPAFGVGLGYWNHELPGCGVVTQTAQGQTRIFEGLFARCHCGAHRHKDAMGRARHPLSSGSICRFLAKGATILTTNYLTNGSLQWTGVAQRSTSALRWLQLYCGR